MLHFLTCQIRKAVCSQIIAPTIKNQCEGLPKVSKPGIWYNRKETNCQLEGPKQTGAIE